MNNMSDKKEVADPKCDIGRGEKDLGKKTENEGKEF